MPEKDDRRRAWRYDHGNLSVSVKPQGFVRLFHKSHVADWMDFNRFGMSFESERRYRVGKRVLLNLSIADQRHESVADVVAVVRNVARLSDRYRCGVQFDFQANPRMKSMEVGRTLISIEHLLKDILRRLRQRLSESRGQHAAPES